MANRIKGITVEIGGDTTGLDKALKSVNSSIKTTQSSLKDVNRLLKLDPKNTELLSQKQKLLKDAIGATKEKLDSLKQAQEQAKQLVSQEAICVEAKLLAEDIEKKANDRAAQIQRAGNAYMDESLRQTEELIAQTLADIQTVREKFRAVTESQARVAEEAAE